MTRITIMSDADTLVLNGNRIWEAGDRSLILKKDGIKGLYGTPATRESVLDRPQMDGAYWPSRLTQGARTVTLDAFAHGLSSIETMQLIDRLNNLTGRELTLLVEDAAGRRMLTGWLAADPEPLMLVTQRHFEFALVITCPDPYKYGDWLWQRATSNRTLQLANTGTAPTWLRFRTSSRITHLDVVYGDAEISWEGDTTSLTLDTRDMIPSAGRITADWAMPVEPGVTPITIRSDCGSLDLGLRPAWR